MTKKISELTPYPGSAPDAALMEIASGGTSYSTPLSDVRTGGLNNVVEDTSPTLGGNLDASTFNIVAPHSNGSPAGAAFAVTDAANGNRLFEIRSGNFRTGVANNVGGEGAFIYVSASQYHGECMIGVDSDPDVNNPHHTRLGIASLSGDPVSIHFGIEEIVAGTGLNDYSTFYINTTSADADTYIYWPLVALQAGRINEAPHMVYDGCGTVYGATTNSAGDVVEYCAVRFRIMDNTAGAQDGVLMLNARKDGASRDVLCISSSGVLITDASIDGNQFSTSFPGAGNLGFNKSAALIADPNGNELIKFPATVSSAINELTISNAAASSPPSITATGGDTDIGLKLAAKGAGTVLVNSGTQTTVDGATAVFQVAQNTDVPWGWIQGLYTNSTAGASLAFSKSRNSTIGAHTIVVDGDFCGDIEAYGSDGTDFEPVGAISFRVDGTPGNNDMPGRIEFRTTADGAASTTVRAVLKSDGGFIIGPNGTSPGAGNLRAAGFVASFSTTVGSLPSAATAGAGARAFVTDATSTTFLSTVAGSGGNKVPVVSDGTNWLIG